MDKMSTLEPLHCLSDIRSLTIYFGFMELRTMIRWIRTQDICLQCLFCNFSTFRERKKNLFFHIWLRCNNTWFRIRHLINLALAKLKIESHSLDFNFVYNTTISHAVTFRNFFLINNF